MKKIKDNKELLNKILTALNLWANTYKLIGTPNETPRYSQLMINSNGIFELKSTQKNLYYTLNLTEGENEFLNNIEHNERWNEYKEIRTEFLLKNHKTISTN